MTEAYSVSSSLHFNSNAEAFVNRLIQDFEKIENIVLATQGKITAFENHLKSLAADKGVLSGLTAALTHLSNIKLNPEFLTKLTEAAQDTGIIAGHSNAIATHAAATAKSWEKIAASMKSARSSASPGGGGSGDGGEGEGGSASGGRRRRYRGWNDNVFNQAAQEYIVRENKAHEKKVDSSYKADRAEAVEIESNEKAKKRSADKTFLGSFREASTIQDNLRAIQRYKDKLYKEDRAEAVEIESNEKAKKRYRDKLYRTDRAEAVEIESNERAKARYVDKVYRDDRKLAEHYDSDANIRKRAKEHERRELYRDATVVGMAGGAAGYGIVHYTEDAVKKNVDYERIMSVFYQNNSTKDRTGEIDKRAFELTRKVKGTNPEMNLKAIAEVFGLVKDIDEAMALGEVYVKGIKTLDALGGGHRGAEEMYKGLQGLESMGDIYGPDGHISVEHIRDRLIELQVTAKNSQNRASAPGFLGWARRARYAGSATSLQYRDEVLPAVIQVLGGDRAGTAQAAFYREFSEGSFTKPTFEFLKKFNLLKPGAEWKPGTKFDMEKYLKGYDLMSQNPYEWVKKEALPDMNGIMFRGKKIDVTDKQQLSHLIGLMKGTNTAGGFLAELMLNLTTIEKEIHSRRETSVDKDGRRIDPYDIDAKHNPQLKIDEYLGALEELKLVYGKLVQGPALEVLKTFTDSLRWITDTLNAMGEDNAKLFAKTVGYVGVALVGLGGIASGAYIFGAALNVVKGFAKSLFEIVKKIANFVLPSIFKGGGGGGEASVAVETKEVADLSKALKPSVGLKLARGIGGGGVGFGMIQYLINSAIDGSLESKAKEVEEARIKNGGKPPTERQLETIYFGGPPKPIDWHMDWTHIKNLVNPWKIFGSDQSSLDMVQPPGGLTNGQLPGSPGAPALNVRLINARDVAMAANQSAARQSNLPPSGVTYFDPTMGLGASFAGGGAR